MEALAGSGQGVIYPRHDNIQTCYIDAHVFSHEAVEGYGFEAETHGVTWA